jgi:hypothetical protein
LTALTRSSSAVAVSSRGGGQGGKIKESRHYHPTKLSFVDAFAPEVTPSLPFSAVEAVTE